VVKRATLRFPDVSRLPARTGGPSEAPPSSAAKMLLGMRRSPTSSSNTLSLAQRPCRATCTRLS
jgi:hypothetical protein